MPRCDPHLGPSEPWGLLGQGMAPYLLSHPGNSVAALAALNAELGYLSLTE